MEILDGVLKETSQVLIRRHGLDVEDHANYVEKTVNRFRNAELNDTVLRVGREPSRKVSRNERLVGPAALAAEYGLSRDFLITTIAAALKFEDVTDPAVKELHRKLQDFPAEKFVKDVMGIEPTHPLSKELTECVKNI
jgi:mannitol-1-phosphate 5-dehydrogenase